MLAGEPLDFLSPTRWAWIVSYTSAAFNNFGIIKVLMQREEKNDSL